MLCPECKNQMVRVRSTPLEDEYKCKNPQCSAGFVIYNYGTKTDNTEDISSCSEEHKESTVEPSETQRA
jgi:hypothetical protein